jgi:hypothetical protein
MKPLFNSGVSRQAFSIDVECCENPAEIKSSLNIFLYQSSSASIKVAQWYTVEPSVATMML